MKDEIKEILDNLKNIEDYLSFSEAKQIEDYITNLQTIEQQYNAILSENAELESKITNLQEYYNDNVNKYEELLVKYSNLQEEIKRQSIAQCILDDEITELQTKIDKTVEYIKENACYGNQEKCCLDDLNYNECDELLEILGAKGEDNGNNGLKKNPVGYTYKKRCQMAIEYINNFSVDKNFSFPLMKRWEENQVKSCIEYEINDTLKKDLLNILQGEENE